jgi:hypothetical protein
MTAAPLAIDDRSENYEIVQPLCFVWRRSRAWRSCLIDSVSGTSATSWDILFTDSMTCILKSGSSKTLAIKWLREYRIEEDGDSTDHACPGVFGQP